jgi:ABC-2 type transport system ATP-binding protein
MTQETGQAPPADTPADTPAGRAPGAAGGTPGTHVIETRDLTRYYGNRRVVDGLNLRVPRGCVYALLGRNGSGKTTTIRMLLGLLDPTRGSASVFGHDCRRLPPGVRGRVGYMAEAHAVYRWMKVREAGAFQAAFHPRWNDRIFRAVIDHFRLSPGAKAGDLSRGERAGLSLALTLAPEPDLLILDDPAIGLDPAARRSLLESMIYVTRRSDRTILFSTHLLSDVERVADYIGVLDRSVLRVSCPVDVFRERVRGFVLRYPGTPPELPPVPGLLHARRSLGELRLAVANVTDETRRALRSLGAQTVDEVPLSLEEALIGYLGERGEKHFFLEDTIALEQARGAA